jgi:transcription elongation factor Elf1
MPHVGLVSVGRTYFCSHCGALYSVRPSRLPKIKNNKTTAKCVVCLNNHRRVEYDRVPIFTLIQRPENA